MYDFKLEFEDTGRKWSCPPH